MVVVAVTIPDESRGTQNILKYTEASRDTVAKGQVYKAKQRWTDTERQTAKRITTTDK